MAAFDVPYNDHTRQAEWAPIRAQAGDVISVATELHADQVDRELRRLNKTGVMVLLRQPTGAELLEPRFR